MYIYIYHKTDRFCYKRFRDNDSPANRNHLLLALERQEFELGGSIYIQIFFHRKCYSTARCKAG